jgi:glucose/arabinose dehydrogenase
VGALLHAACVALALCSAATPHARGAGSVSLKPYVSGFSSPIYVAAPRNERDRIYVVEQGGVIKAVIKGKVRARPFLNITNLVTSGGERGLLSVAFHPNYAKNHRLYVDYTDRNGDTRVVEYRSDKRFDHVLTSTSRELLFVAQPYPNHNGGQLQFGPDGQLYIGMGDGGSGGDPGNRAQSLSTMLGKLLRINVNQQGAKAQVYAYGLRNPWRFSFDRSTKDLYIGDVGQNAWEEIDYLKRGTKPLTNFGWHVYEGNASYESDQEPNTAGKLVFPIAVYAHGPECSVTGGYVYRGTAVPSIKGRYFYGDYCSGKLWSLKVSGGKATSRRTEPFSVPELSSFGEDARGELYATSLGGTVYRFTK